MRLTVAAWVLLAAVADVAARGTAAGPLFRQVGRVLDGEELFRAHCASCHGRTGKGDGPAARALKAAPPDLTLIEQRSGRPFSRERVARFVENGEPAVPAHGSKDMPVWGPIFAGLGLGSYRPVNPHIDDVVTYLESIQQRR